MLTLNVWWKTEDKVTITQCVWTTSFQHRFSAFWQALVQLYSASWSALGGPCQLFPAVHTVQAVNARRWVHLRYVPHRQRSQNFDAMYFSSFSHAHNTQHTFSPLNDSQSLLLTSVRRSHQGL